MSGQPGRIFIVLFFVLSVLVSNGGSTFAQSEPTVLLTSIDTRQFPQITAYLDVHDAQGEFVHGLTPQNVTVQEDGVTIPISQLDELTPGVQFVIAISPGDSFTIRDGMGISRYDYFTQGFLSSALTSQSASQSTGVDDYSLLTLGGPQLTHASEAASMKSALESYVPEVLETEPDLEILASALQVASDPTARPGMERAILFITTPLQTDASIGLQSIIASANQQNIHIFVWVLAAQEAFLAPEITQLRNLAEQTQGSFWGFSHDEPVPALESLLEPLRYIYQLGYASRVTSAGSHQLSAQTAIDGSPLTSPNKEFEVNLQAPNLAILDPPLEITRTYSYQPTPEKAMSETDLLPIEQILKLKIDFPDGYTRSIVQSRLYVEGVIVAENANPPYNEFLWDLRPYTQNGEYRLFVDATDDLGLVGKSPEVTIKITVPSTTQGIMVIASQNRPILLGAGIVVACSLIVLGLILGGRIHPKPHPGQPKPLKRVDRGTLIQGFQPGGNGHPPDRATSVTSHVTSKPTPNQLSHWWQRLPWAKHPEEPVLAKAYLIPLVGFDEPTLPAALQITTDEVSLGSDGQQSNLVIRDASIDPIHAKIGHDGNSFVISDAGSVAGTWVNYEQVSLSGTLLSHMDIIHLGRIGFRFQLSEPGQTRKVVVTVMDTRE